jgi:hypothetical protein
MGTHPNAPSTLADSSNATLKSKLNRQNLTDKVFDRFQGTYSQVLYNHC